MKDMREEEESNLSSDLDRVSHGTQVSKEQPLCTPSS